MEISITQVLLPLVLAFIMFSLGITLKPVDFTNIRKNPKAFTVGLLGQLFALPIMTFLLIQIFSISNDMAFGMMILSFCPGGATSNMLTQLLRGNVALSISLTAVMSLVTIITVPVFISLAYAYFISTENMQVSILSMGIKMFLIALLPVLLGMTLHHFAPNFTVKISKAISTLAWVLFVVLVVGAIAKHKTVLFSQFSVLGPLCILLVVTLLISGLLVSKALGLNWTDAKTVALEVGIQNGTMGMVLAGLVMASNEALPLYAIPSAIYSVLMYFIALPYCLLMRNKS